MNSIEQKNLRLPFGAALPRSVSSLDFDAGALLQKPKLNKRSPFTASVALSMSGSETISSQIHCWVLSFCKEATTSQVNPKAGAGAGELG